MRIEAERVDSRPFLSERESKDPFFAPFVFVPVLPAAPQKVTLCSS